MTTIVSIGRNFHATGEPMSINLWNDFQGYVRRAMLNACGSVYFHGTGSGIYEGAAEESYTVIADDPATTWQDLKLRQTLRDLARIFGQDSIAVTYGETEFLTATMALPKLDPVNA
jgi:hypothetical protein